MQVKQGTTLYLCLEDSQLHTQNRLFDVTEDAPANVRFCTESRILGDGLRNSWSSSSASTLIRPLSSLTRSR